MFSGTGEVETKSNVFSHEILDTGQRESQKKLATTSGWISNLAGCKGGLKNGEERDSVKSLNGLDQALHGYFEH